MLAYYDCFSGISGDMSLGALIDAGVPVETLRSDLASLPVVGYTLSAERVADKGIAGTRVSVELDPAVEQPHRHLSDILAIIAGSKLSAGVKERAAAVFRRLAEAEARVHGESVEHVHFHEVGAVDAIVDVVGTVRGLEILGVERIYASALPTGAGTVRTAHGVLPVPAPATLELLRSAGAPITPSSAEAELVTPTGAALLVTLAEFGRPAMELRAIGYGFGRKQLPWANCARLWVGLAPDGDRTDRVSVIEANVDDTTPELLGAAMSRLLAAGALDVYFTPIQMKKNRPGVKLTALCGLDHEGEVASVILRETSSLGVRITRADRVKAKRWQQAVSTRWGEVRVKVKQFDGRITVAPEYDDCVRVADSAGVPVIDVYDAARAAAHDLGLTP